MNNIIVDLYNKFDKLKQLNICDSNIHRYIKQEFTYKRTVTSMTYM